MKTLEEHDVDAFGMLDSPAPEQDRLQPEPVLPEPVAEPAEPEPRQVPPLSIDGNGNDTALRDINKPRFDIGALVLTDGLLQLARASSEKRSGRGLQDRDALVHLADRYVEPPGLLGLSSGGQPKTAIEILRDRRVLLLTAEAHDGGQFAACMRLGHELRKGHPDLVVREELIDELRVADLLVDHEPAVVIGDLRDAHDKLQSVRRGLVEFVEELERHLSYLILIIPSDQARRFEDFLPGRVHHLSRPTPLKVFARHAIGLDSESFAHDSVLTDRLRNLWPPEVKELADAVSDRIGQDEDPAHALQEVLRSQRDEQGPSLRELVRKRQDSGDIEWLALLLAATLLEGAETWHIVDAADRLLALNGAQRKKTVPLLRPSPYTRLLALDYESFNCDDRKFQPRGTGTSVLRFFWREHRDLRKTLKRWIGELPRQISDLTREELERLADRCAELAGEDSAEVALELAEGWAATKSGTDSDGDRTSDHPTARYRRSIAVRLLTTTATDPAVGTRIRQKLLEWSKGANSDLQLLTAEVCAGIGESFPRIALTRLKHLANSENPHVRIAVLEATRQIGTDLGVSSFLRYVSEWFDNAAPARLSLLADSVATVLMKDKEDVDIETAAAFWRQALDTMPPESLRPVVASWLHVAAGASPAQRDLMVEPLVLATESKTQRIAQILYASRSAPNQPDPAESDPLAATLHRLSVRLDEVDPVWR
ncbi:hypothetical protein JOF56_010287 [Kibdelosporangium banguiense]|uniref:HEAT repeat domain-containing protein n=1 Tax=Kibdelosporangium banguiense TaxID=1365924 RepID=A0ABS4TZT0_9PSEU|nr:hypothetical protein [Kibdelosporangium banguiense]MBP2329902.1 hypothetical protein [Kibdelosporangium banguiense]